MKAAVYYGLCIALAGKTTRTDEQPLSHTLSPYHQMRVFPNTNLRYTISWKNFGDSSLLVPKVTNAGITLVRGCIANAGHIPNSRSSAVPSPKRGTKSQDAGRRTSALQRQFSYLLNAHINYSHVSGRGHSRLCLGAPRHKPREGIKPWLNEHGDASSPDTAHGGPPFSHEFGAVYPDPGRTSGCACGGKGLARVCSHD